MSRDRRTPNAADPRRMGVSPMFRRARAGRPCDRRAFTLIEMLVATVLAAVLMTAVLAVMVGVARDRRLLRSLRRPSVAPALDLLEWDLRNAATMSHGPNDILALVGNDGVDRDSLAPDGRRVRVTYRAVAGDLWRQQEYLDDPVRPAPWQERVAGGFQSLVLRPSPADPTPVPPRLRIELVTAAASGGRDVTR